MFGDVCGVCRLCVDVGVCDSARMRVYGWGMCEWSGGQARAIVCVMCARLCMCALLVVCVFCGDICVRVINVYLLMLTDMWLSMLLCCCH